jgi:hypothetical protein
VLNESKFIVACFSGDFFTITVPLAHACVRQRFDRSQPYRLGALKPAGCGI